MTDLKATLMQVRNQLQPAWHESRSRSIEQKVWRLHHRRRRQKNAFYAVSAIILLGSTAVTSWHLSQHIDQVRILNANTDHSGQPAQADSVRSKGARSPNNRGGGRSNLQAVRTPPPHTTQRLRHLTDQAVQFTDGSTATFVHPHSRLRPILTTAKKMIVQVPEGGVRFVIAKRPTRVFRVEIDTVSVEVLGTQFSTERVAPTQVRVSVDEGVVRVRWPGGVKKLIAGQSELFSTTPQPRQIARSKPLVSQSWKNLAQRQQYHDAYQVLKNNGPIVYLDRPADLLLAADVARLSHHPAEAVAPLQKIIAAHRTDLRAPIAAFTLGRVLLDELSQPARAAAAFAQAYALAPLGPLAEDALVRQIESWRRAGDATRMQQSAKIYMHKFAKGRRLEHVQQLLQK